MLFVYFLKFRVFIFKMEVYLIYNVLVSAVQQSDSVTHYTCSFFHILSSAVHPRTLSVGPCAAPSDRGVYPFYMWWCASAHPSPSPPPRLCYFRCVVACLKKERIFCPTRCCRHVHFPHKRTRFWKCRFSGLLAHLAPKVGSL